MTPDQWKSPSQWKQHGRSRERRPSVVDGLLNVALVVVMIFLVCFTIGGLSMVFGYWLFS